MSEELKQFGNLEEEVSLKKYNTYHIDTKSKYVLHVKDLSNLQAFLSYAKEKRLPYLLLGNGSNVILTDRKYPGVILKLDEFNEIQYNKNTVSVGAGVMINKLSLDILNHDLAGLEWASGIPGTVGGCLFGNAEAYKVSTFEYLKEVTYIDLEGQVVTKKKADLSFGYRTSFFKEHPGNIIIKALFLFPNGAKEISLNLIKDRMQRRQASQPLNYPSAGSVFRNPAPDLPSGKLIDDLGLKGFQIGDAKISDLHANFIINMGSATGKDILNLISLVRDSVKEKYHLDLVLEQEYKSW